MAYDFDVFLSHNSKDKPFVERLYEELTKCGVKPWLDSKEIVGGEIGLAMIDEGLRSSRTIAVIIGSEGFGRYHEEEHWAAIMRSIERGVLVIPVYLPGFEEARRDELPDLLALRSFIKFKADATERKSFEALLRSVLKDAGDERLDQFLKGPTARTPATARPSVVQEKIDDAISALTSDIKRSGTLSIFIGAGSGEARPYAIARELMKELDFNTSEYGALLPSMEVAGSYYEIDKHRRLEDRVVELIRAEPPQDPPRMYSLIAQLVQRLRAIGVEPARRKRLPYPPLIMTTALDVLTERALLRAGIPFARIVQHSSGDKLTINEYTDVTVDGTQIIIRSPKRTETVASTDIDALDAAIEMVGARPPIKASDEALGSTAHPIRDLSLSQFQTEGQPLRPILYKYHGSQDVPGSCALSTDQYFRLAVQRAIPEQLRGIIGNSPALFFPAGGLDAAVRHVYHTLLRRAYEDGRGNVAWFAVVRPPRDPEPDSYRQLEMRMPGAIQALERQMGIPVLETGVEDFLETLIQGLS